MDLAIFGYGGHAREVAAQIGKDVKFFVDDEYANGNILGISKFDPKQFEIIIAVSNPKERENIKRRLPQETRFFTFIHPSVLILNSDVEIGEGSFIGANCILTTNIKIGSHAILNRGNQIGHDCVIGDFFSAMPGSIVSGNVNIGNRVYLGTNSSIIEKKYLLDDITIGANAVVVKNLVQPGNYVGCPAKLIVK